MASNTTSMTSNSTGSFTTRTRIFVYFSLLYVLIIAGVILHPLSGDISPMFVYPRNLYDNVMHRDINLNSSERLIDCLFTDYNYEAAMSIKSMVLSKLSLTNSIQIYKPGVPLTFGKFLEDKHIRLKQNRTKIYHAKRGHNERITEFYRYTDDIGITPQKTCALVGNAGILLDSGCGREIDTHDFVVRNNLAKIEGYITDVGSKTSLMTINAQGLRDTVKSLLKNGTDQRSVDDYVKLRFLNDTVLWFIKGIGKGELLGQLYSISQYHNMSLRLAYSPEQIRPIAERIWKIKHPTTGLILYTFVAGLCDKISLYGFYPFSTGLSRDAVQHHYYEQKKFNYQTGTKHTFVDEYRIFMQLHKQGALRFVGDSCQKLTHDKRTKEK